MSTNSNLISVPKFALLKQTNKPRIYSLIERGEIVPEIVDGRPYIDKIKYADYVIPKRLKKQKGMAEQIKELNALLRNLENIVYAHNPNGRGKNKVVASEE